MKENNVKIFDCTLREVGYQTGWFFDADFCREFYQFAMSNSIDYIELGFMHTMKHDPGRGDFRYCTDKQEEIAKLFSPVKNRVKISTMIDLQRPFGPLKNAKGGVIDAVRILTRSHETDEGELKKMVDNLRANEYKEVFINFTSAGYNTVKMNQRFAEIAKDWEVPTIYFADTESVMTQEYIGNAIEICHKNGLKCGIHLHDKNGTAEKLCEFALNNGADYTDITLLGLGGKWRDGNLSTEFILRHLGIQPGYELTMMKNELIEQLIKFNKHSAAG